VDRAWNALAAPVSTSWDDGTTWTHSYDKNGRPEKVSWRNPSAVLAEYERSVAGLPRSRSSSYDQRREWRYDVMGRVIADRVFRPPTATSAELLYGSRSYEYSSLGELRATAGIVDTMNMAAQYSYDGRGRLIRAEGPLQYDANISYSAAGNVVSAAVRGTVDVPQRNVKYEYGALDWQAVDRLTDVETGRVVADLSYDSAGNLIERLVPAGKFRLTWDGDNQLREVSGPSGTEVYWFGLNGERMAALSSSGIRLWFAESETHFTPDGAQILRWHNVSAGEPVARITNGTSLELQYADALQNLMLSINQTGSVGAAFVYGAFGEVVGQKGQDDHRRQFNGKENDAISGLRHYGFRSYDPILLRWTSADPLYVFAPDAAWTEPQRANLYTFSLNNPVRYYDPDGRDPETEKKKKEKEEAGEDVEVDKEDVQTDAEKEAEAKKQKSESESKAAVEQLKWKLVGSPRWREKLKDEYRKCAINGEELISLWKFLEKAEKQASEAPRLDLFEDYGVGRVMTPAHRANHEQFRYLESGKDLYDMNPGGMVGALIGYVLNGQQGMLDGAAIGNALGAGLEGFVPSESGPPRPVRGPR
jgi:RHS repeat-associated protein